MASPSSFSFAVKVYEDPEPGTWVQKIMPVNTSIEICLTCQNIGNSDNFIIKLVSIDCSQRIKNIQIPIHILEYDMEPQIIEFSSLKEIFTDDIDGKCIETI